MADPPIYLPRPILDLEPVRAPHPPFDLPAAEALVSGGERKRAAEVAIMDVLEQLGVLTAEVAGALLTPARPAVRNTRGEWVGAVRSELRLALGAAPAVVTGGGP